MSTHTVVHTPVGGPLLTRTMRILLMIIAVGMIAMLYRFATGLHPVSALNDGYPWGVWIALDVVTGTALGCGGYAVALLVYILNRGQYHPLVRPAVLTSLLGYGLAVLAVTVDLGRFWELWKVPVMFWRWSHSPQLEVALCVAAYTLVLLLELSPAFFEKWRHSANTGLRELARTGLGLIDRVLPFLLALGMLLPTMHQSSLGTMMMLAGPKLHPLWLTPWLPFLFLVGCLGMGYAIVVLEATFSARAFGRPRETAMLASLSTVVAWVALFWAAFRVGEVVLAGELGLVLAPRGMAFLVEVGLHLAGALILLSPVRRASPMWQTRAAILLVLAGTVYRINTYLVAFMPGREWSYFPSLTELFITFGIFALEIALYIAAVKLFPILSGPAPAPAVARR
jgi:Ni/Fe-hydrogenase subunit HybB-like protein